MNQELDEQLNQADQTPDEAMANLAFANNLQEQIMPKAPVEGDISPETAPQDEGMEKEDDTHDMRSEMDDLRKEVRDMIKKEIGGIKKEIKNLLNE